MVSVHITKNCLGVPAILVDVTEEHAIITHHARLTGRKVVELDKAAIAIPFP